MFEQALYEDINADFTVNGKKYPIYFGEVEQNAKATYIVQTSLDYGDTPLTQCRNDYTEFMEFRIYGLDFYAITTIRDALVNYLANLDYVGNYTILKNIKHTSVVGNDVENGLPCATAAREFVYTES
ncbi:MAG: hypothetical protein LBK53_09390 [Heliobacteriaceae bacterium]|nr:hypothetical protein [Heliobacteriaceae bacterium]